MVDFCDRHEIRHQICGKIVVATEVNEVTLLHALLERGKANGLQGLELLDSHGIRDYEPHAAGIAGIRVPQEGIVDFPAVAEALAQDIASLGGEVKYSSEVIGLRTGAGNWTIQTTSSDYDTDFLINCGGLHCDRLSRMAGERDSCQIVPFRGEYFRLVPQREHLVRNLIYPVPDPKFPFLGVHFTRLIHGGVEAGPNAVLAFAREGYRFTDVCFRDLVETMTFRGFWQFLRRYPKMCFDELRRSLSKALFCRSLQRLVPEIQIDDLTPGDAGVRAQSLSPSGELVQDFRLVRQNRALHVLNAPSPAATASLAIADEIVDQIHDVFV
jgi:L-2-hydroxyglutarate oxidase LhgO